jgi:hypothetical protein
VIPFDNVIMAESCTPFSKPIVGVQKPIMGAKNVYSEEKWQELNKEFNELRKTIKLGTREAVVAVLKFICSLDYRIPYANFEYQQRWDKNYAVYPYVGLNQQWGERFISSKGKKLPLQGLYCSALVEWAFVNAGIEYDSKIITDARKYRGIVMSTKKAFAAGLIQIGDTIHTSQKKSKTGRIYNHIGVVLEVNGDYILVAEERPLRGLIVTKASKFSRLDTVVINSELYNK